MGHRNNIKIEIEINSNSSTGSAKVLLRPVEHHIKTLSCVLDMLKEVFISVGYSIDSFSLHSDSKLIEIILYFRLKERESKENPQHEVLAFSTGGG